MKRLPDTVTLPPVRLTRRGTALLLLLLLAALTLAAAEGQHLRRERCAHGCAQAATSWTRTAATSWT